MTRKLVYKPSYDGCRAVPRSIRKDEPLPKNYFHTEEEALLEGARRLAKRQKEYEAGQEEADRRFAIIEGEYNLLLSRLRKDFQVTIYADATASDDTNLETFTSVEVVVNNHTYYYRIDE